MGRLVFSLIVAILLLVFASQNMHEAPIRVVFGPTVELPLILIIAVGFISGFSVAIFAVIIRGSKKNSHYEDEY
ncbi:MAG: DUF1049 domain-containing protein [Magnetococcales bacterium]|nr:DUF1049 domain-containing protein [Magnetococcales bacterium]